MWHSWQLWVTLWWRRGQYDFLREESKYIVDNSRISENSGFSIMIMPE